MLENAAETFAGQAVHTLRYCSHFYNTQDSVIGFKPTGVPPEGHKRIAPYTHCHLTCCSSETNRVIVAYEIRILEVIDAPHYPLYHELRTYRAVKDKRMQSARVREMLPGWGCVYFEQNMLSKGTGDRYGLYTLNAGIIYLLLSTRVRVLYQSTELNS